MHYIEDNRLSKETVWNNSSITTCHWDANSVTNYSKQRSFWMVIHTKHHLRKLFLQHRIINWGTRWRNGGTWILAYVNIMKGTIWCKNAKGTPENFIYSSYSEKERLHTQREKTKATKFMRTYKQDFLLSMSSTTIKSTIGKDSFKFLLPILDISSPLALIK